MADVDVKTQTKQAESLEGCKVLAGFGGKNAEEMYAAMKAMVAQSRKDVANGETPNRLMVSKLDYGSGSRIDLTAGNGLLGVEIASVHFDEAGKPLPALDSCYPRE
jgi:hypothetical protein